MMDKISTIFKNRSPVFEKFAGYGFRKKGSSYKYSKTLLPSGFELTVTVTKAGRVKAVVIDPDTGEYTLHLTDSAGSFVGEVREGYERTLADIADKCFMRDVFGQEQTKKLIGYAREKYGSEPEFLWEKFDDNAVLRRGDTDKWYAVILTVSKRKLGLKSDETVEIIDLRLPPGEMSETVDGKRYFGGWHMNKKHWYTMILDGSVDFSELCERLDVSYGLAVK